MSFSTLPWTLSISGTGIIHIIQINTPMGPGDEMKVPGDLEDYSNMLSHSWSTERNTPIHICDK